MAELLLPNFMAAAREGQARGQQRGLASLMGQAIQQPDQRQAIIGKIAGTDPGAAMQAQQHFATQDATQKKANRDRLVQLSEVMLKAPNMAAQVYPEFRASLSAELGPNVNLPEQFDPGALDAAKAFYTQANSEGYTLSPGSQRFGPDNQVVASVPFAPQKPDFQLYEGANGPVWIPKPGAGGAAPSVSAPGKPLNPPQDFGQLVSSFGARPTSLFRDPEHNRQVGGVANSQHTAGTAGDFQIPPQQRAAFIAQAKQMGYEAIDEGDHVHVELPPGANASGQFGPGQSVQSGGVQGIPVSGVTPKPKSSGGTFAPLNSDEIAQLGLPPGTVAQRNMESGQVSVINKPDARAGTGEVPLSAGEAAKVRTNFKETREALGMFQALDQALKDVPGGIGTALDPEKRGRLGTSYNNARSALRILYNTGVLQPGELPMLEEALRNPASYGALIDPRTRPQLRGQLDELYRTVDRGIKNQVASYPQIFDPQKYAESKARKQGGQPREITTKAQFDALPSGAVYLEDGKQYRKP